MNEIINISTLINYIKYIIDYAELIYSHNIITDNEYESLINETELFFERMSSVTFIQQNLKNELLNVQLLKVTKEFSLRGLLRLVFSWTRYYDTPIDHGLEMKRRENVKQFKDRMTNILDLIIVKN